MSNHKIVTFNHCYCYFYSGCQKGETHEMTLKMSGCEEEEFTCNDGQCIDINLRCDQIINCRDKSDEENCQLMVLESGYKKNVVPFTTVRNIDQNTQKKKNLI